MAFLKRFLTLLPALILAIPTYADSNGDSDALAKQLGWVTTPVTSCDSCGGHYDEKQFPATSPISLKDAPSTINAPPPVNYKINGDVNFENGVTITQPGRSLYADQATITPNLATGKLDAISATGNIRIAQPGELLLAKSMQANLINNQASVTDVTYLIRVGEYSPTLLASQPSDSNFTGFAHGSADAALQTGQKLFSFTNATYSTCSPLSHTWELDASSIDIDQNEGRGYAQNTVLKIHGFPIFYLPYFSFPTSSARKSGFLYGNLMNTSESGLALSLPYYFNLAPNYDYTLTPTIYTKRGVLFDNYVRYLTPQSNGTVDFQFIPYDQGDNNLWRYGYAINDNTNFNQNWNANVNYNGVSDETYLQDFNVFNANQVLLNRSLNLNYQDAHWNFSGLLQSYQIVNTTLITANRPYNELPSLNLVGQYPNILGPLSFSLGSNFTDFTKSPATTFETPPVEGQRLNLTPTISLPLTQSYGYLTPSLSYYSTTYTLTNAIVNGFPNTPSINVPIINVDSSLYFDRDISWRGQTYSQTLSPRLYYLYVPYENQNNVPVFDTTIVPFSYSQLFTTNRFSGYDRMGDANQLSYALSSGLNDATGNQILSGGVGQIWYFENRLVSLCQNQPGAPPCIQIENPDYTQNFSDIAAYFTYNFNPTWSLTASVTYNTPSSFFDSQEYTLSYVPNAMDVFNISYQNNHQNYSLLSNQQILAGTPPPRSSILNASFVWGLTPKWASFASLNYSLENSGPIDEFAGIQYSSCCWAIRLGDYRYVVNNNPNTPNVLTGSMSSAFMVQFLLKGLGNVSSGQSADNLLNTIPSYHGQLGF